MEALMQGPGRGRDPKSSVGEVEGAEEESADAEEGVVGDQKGDGVGDEGIPLGSDEVGNDAEAEQELAVESVGGESDDDETKADVTNPMGFF